MPVVTSTPTKERSVWDVISPIRSCRGIENPDYKPSDGSFADSEGEVEDGLAMVWTMYTCVMETLLRRRSTLFSTTNSWNGRLYKSLSGLEIEIRLTFSFVFSTNYHRVAIWRNVFSTSEMWTEETWWERKKMGIVSASYNCWVDGVCLTCLVACNVYFFYTFHVCF